MSSPLANRASRPLRGVSVLGSVVLVVAASVSLWLPKPAWAYAGSVAVRGFLPRVPSSRRALSVAHADPLEMLGIVGKEHLDEDKIQQEMNELISSLSLGVSGALLGCILLGPLGALLGAELGVRWGRQWEQDKVCRSDLGLDRHLATLAHQSLAELSDARAGLEQVELLRGELQERVVHMKVKMQEQYNRAAEAVEDERDDLARAALVERQRLTARFDGARESLAKAQQQRDAMQSVVSKLQERALEALALHDRAQRATLVAKSTPLTGFPVLRDPLLKTFDALGWS